MNDEGQFQHIVNGETEGKCVIKMQNIDGIEIEKIVSHLFLVLLQSF